MTFQKRHHNLLFYVVVTVILVIVGTGLSAVTNFASAAVTITLPTPTIATPTLTPGTYTISGNLFTDVNKNGIKDAGESNYSGTPTVTASRGTVTVNANGTYTVSNLTPGVVTISISPPSDYAMTYPLNGPPPSFQVTVGPGCTTNGARGAQCN